MRILISESKLEDLKKIFYNKWDKQGYASYDSKMARVFNIDKYINDEPSFKKTGYYMTPNKLIRIWVEDWNKRNGITDLSILDEFGMKLYEGKYSRFYESTIPRQFTYETPNNYLEFNIAELRFDGDTLTLYDIGFNLETAILDGENVGDTLREIEGDELHDAEDWEHTVERFREDAIGLIYDYVNKNYVNKMGGDVDIEFEYIDSFWS